VKEVKEVEEVKEEEKQRQNDAEGTPRRRVKE
jgi:hypothetical protein